jgi:phage terminase large subunit GpA-like protein
MLTTAILRNMPPAEDLIRFAHHGNSDISKLRLRRRLATARRMSLRPPPRMSVVEWAENTRRMSKEASAQGGGYWKTSRVEVARGPMLAVTERGVKKITLMTCTQLAKTEFILNTIGYFVNLDPCPMLMVQPTLSMAETFSKDRLMPMVRDAQEKGGDGERILSKIFATGTGDSTILSKKFAGGHLTMVGSNSSGDLAMRPVGKLFFDEVDKYPPSAEGEGDPISLAEERADTFGSQMLAIYCCSPTSLKTSRIYRNWCQSDQRLAYVACPACKHEQTLEWENVQWTTDKGGVELHETARIVCVACKHPWAEHERLTQIRDTTKWRQTRPFIHCDTPQDPKLNNLWTHDGRAACSECGELAVSNAHAGFNVSKLYSPFHPIPHLVEKWILQRDDPGTKMVFWNTQLARVWSEDTEELDTTGLKKRGEAYSAAVPRGVGVLTAGVDGQKDRLECEVVGWGYKEESWAIGHFVIYGDPSTAEPWAKLDFILNQAFDTEDGRRLTVQATCVDAGGHNADLTTRWCNARTGRRIWACYGLAERGGQRANIFPDKASYRNRLKLKKFGLGVNAAKDLLYARLGVKNHGPTFMHWPSNPSENGMPKSYDDEYFQQFTAEHRVLKPSGGVLRSMWEKKKDDGRNEAWDLRVYALAALRGLELHGVPVSAKLAEFAPKRLSTEHRPMQPTDTAVPAPKGITKRVLRPIRWKIGGR